MADGRRRSYLARMPEAFRILDGGLATELERAGADLSGGLWSARILAEQPELIRAVHRSYFDAGADIAITASYQVSYSGYAEIGIDGDGTDRLLRRSVELAREARDLAVASERPRWIAASVGPFGATRHDGSEYHGNYGLSVAELRDFHRRRLRVLAESGADLLACETIPSLDEARAIAGLLTEIPGARAWFSFTSRDDRHSAHGEPFEDCAALLDRLPQVVAIGVNCVQPEDTASLIAALRRGTIKPIVVYPNSGEQWDGAAQRWVGHATGTPFHELVREWVRASATWIGGCCRTTPEHVRAIRRELLGS